VLRDFGVVVAAKVASSSPVAGGGGVRCLAPPGGGGGGGWCAHGTRRETGRGVGLALFTTLFLRSNQNIN
jgi:hypothetical protein